MSPVAAAILAAGRGERLGGETPKPLVEVAGRPLVAWSLAAAIGSGLRPTVLVVGHGSATVRTQATEAVIVVHANRWRRGIAHSLRAALSVVEPYAQVSALCVGLADQPLVGSDAYRRLATAHADGAALAVATYHGERGNPVLLARTLWPEANRLEDDVGARSLMDRHPVVEVDCTDTGRPTDVDTPDDLRAIQTLLEG